jgi:hypothetical protein
MAKVPLEEVKFFLKLYRDECPEAVDDALSKIDESNLPDIDHEEEEIIAAGKDLAKDSIDYWRRHYSALQALSELEAKVYAQGNEDLLNKYEALIERVREKVKDDFEEAKNYKLEADTLEQYGLEAHSSILKDSLFLIVPLVAYILLNRVR